MEVLPADFAWVVCEVWRVIGDSFAAAGCCAGHGVSAAVRCVIGLQLKQPSLCCYFNRMYVSAVFSPPIDIKHYSSPAHPVSVSVPIRHPSDKRKL